MVGPASLAAPTHVPVCGVRARDGHGRWHGSGHPTEVGNATAQANQSKHASAHTSNKRTERAGDGRHKGKKRKGHQPRSRPYVQITLTTRQSGGIAGVVRSPTDASTVTSNPHMTAHAPNGEPRAKQETKNRMKRRQQVPRLQAYGAQLHGKNRRTGRQQQHNADGTTATTADRGPPTSTAASA